MKIKFEEFILESKNYNLYKGVSNLKQILLDDKIKLLKDEWNDYNWSSPMRRNLGVKDGVGISVTRNFSTAVGYGNCVIEFDTQKLSDKYKIIPIVENLDYYLNLPKNKTKGLSIAQELRLKEFGKEYWDIKTNKDAYDFNISEEIIVSNEVSIKYIKKVYIIYSNRDRTKEIELLKLNNIPYEIISEDDKYLSNVKYRKNKINTYSQM